MEFRKQLAHVDKSTRDNALQQLLNYLKLNAQLSHLDLLKLHKGLYYCIFLLFLNTFYKASGCLINLKFKLIWLLI
jgi:hypothetical protein